MNKKNLIILILLTSVLSSILIINNRKEEKEIPINQDVIFSCNEGKYIIADFYNRSVFLYLSDGREINLPQTISASGIRYANENESLVFWSKGDTAFITENNDSTFKDCILEEKKDNSNDKIYLPVECIISGCSGEICFEESMVSPCIYKPEYDCYKDAVCKKQEDNKCGWTQTEELSKCFEEKRNNGLNF